MFIFGLGMSVLVFSIINYAVAQEQPIDITFTNQIEENVTLDTGTEVINVETTTPVENVENIPTTETEFITPLSLTAKNIDVVDVPIYQEEHQTL